MPIEVGLVSDKILPKASSISLSDLLKITFNEIRDYALETQRSMGYVKDLVTVPSKRLSGRKDLRIYDSLSEAIIINVAFRMMSDEHILEYSESTDGPGMRVNTGTNEETLVRFIETAEESMKMNEWLYKMVSEYLRKEALRK